MWIRISKWIRISTFTMSKRKAISLEDKYDAVIQMEEKRKTQTQYESSNGGTRKRLRDSKFEDLNDSLWLWYQ